LPERGGEQGSRARDGCCGAALAPGTTGHGREQLAGIRMSRRREDLGCESVFDDLALTHDRDGIAHLRRHAQIVRDEEHGQSESFANIGEQTQDLRLHRYIERGYRLVGDEYFRVERECARESDALPLSPENSCG